MTRTERSTFPRALQKDRHVARNGFSDPNHLQKNGGGAHGWGRLDSQLDDEMGAYDDEPSLERDEEIDEAVSASSSNDTAPDKPARKQSITLTEEERQNALKIRQQALKSDGVDLGSIARSSHAVSTSPPQ